MIGALGNLTCFSFYANKNLTTAEGGMVTTDSDELTDKIEVYPPPWSEQPCLAALLVAELLLSDALYPGFKYNMPDLIAALGIPQLQKVEGVLLMREHYAQIFDEAFADMPGVCLQPRPTGGETRHALHLYVLILDLDQFTVTRNDILNALLAENIGAALHYRALHMHPYYCGTYGYAPEDYPIAYAVGESIMSLPLTPCMTEADLQDVIEGVSKVLTAYRR